MTYFNQAPAVTEPVPPVGTPERAAWEDDFWASPAGTVVEWDLQPLPGPDHEHPRPSHVVTALGAMPAAKWLEMRDQFPGQF
jgi:hypothetical protein